MSNPSKKNGTDKRKGLLPGQFLGAVVVQYESDSSGQKPEPVPRTSASSPDLSLFQSSLEPPL